ncbi:hypothetical protein [Gymnodinialimonas sp.]
MFNEMGLIYGYDGLFGLYHRTDMKLAERMDAMSDIFDQFNANDGAAILALPFTEAVALSKIAGDAVLLAQSVRNSPNASVTEISAAVRLEAAARKTLEYLTKRPDHEKIAEMAKNLGKQWEEYISPIIERHVETGARLQEAMKEITA